MYLAYLESIGLPERDLEPAMAAAAELDLTVLLHCEDGEAVAARTRQLREAGRTRTRRPSPGPDRPHGGAAVRTALDVAARTGARPYIVHVSTGAAMAAVAAARADGRPALAETCPQYLLLDETVYGGDFVHAAAAVMSPPLRPACQAEALRGLLGRGAFDTIATDHCAFSLAQKERGRDDFTRIPGGAAGVEHRLSLLWTMGVPTGLLDAPAWVRLVAENPARIFGLWPHKGCLRPGSDADLVLWDPHARRTISAAGGPQPLRPLRVGRPRHRGRPGQGVVPRRAGAGRRRAGGAGRAGTLPAVRRSAMGFERIVPAACTAAVLVLVLAVGGPSAAADASGRARAAVAAAQTVTPGGVDELKAVKIGGIDQWISVRGDDPANPVLLFLHGGPGSPMMPVAWTFQRPWEESFTVVQWDQRGAGKTFAASGPQPDSTMTVARMQADAEELIALLRRTYGQDKIFLMGHSWGTILGLRIARDHPEWLHAYIGVGQVINGKRNETVSWRETLARARKLGNDQAVAELTALAPYPAPTGPTPLEKVIVERKWVTALGGMAYGKSEDDESVLRAASPLYTDADCAAVERGEMFSVLALLPEAETVDFDDTVEFGCPVVFFAGGQDRATPTSIVVDWFNRVQAPAKKLFIVDHAAHYVVNEAPGEVLLHLVRDVRPLADAR